MKLLRFVDCLQWWFLGATLHWTFALYTSHHDTAIENVKSECGVFIESCACQSAMKKCTKKSDAWTDLKNCGMKTQNVDDLQIVYNDDFLVQLCFEHLH